MQRWAKAGMALVAACLAIPAFAQLNISQGEGFLKALEERDNAAALQLVGEPGSRLINYRGYQGETGLHISTRNRDQAWVNYLLDKGADPDIGDRNGDTALIIAARIGFDEGADDILRYKADVDAANRRGETALIAAVQQRRPRIVELLLKAGANPDKADHVAGYTARDYAKQDSRNPQLLRLIEKVKSTKKKVAGPSLN